MEVLSHPNRVQTGVDPSRSVVAQRNSVLSGSAFLSACPVYDLRLDGACSDRYYADTAAFCDLLLDEIEVRAHVLLDHYSRHAQEYLRESPRSRGEYSLDLLVLGLALRHYRAASESTPGWAVELTREFLWLRGRSAAFKPIADFGRAILNSVFLAAGINAKPATSPPSLAQLPRLIEWLSASGEFTQEAMRLNNWRSCLSTLPPDECSSWLAECTEIFDWFEREAKIALGAYTAGVAQFLATESRRHRCREDQILCSRKAVEYHLSMVGAEIMNRGLQRQFQNTSRRIVLVPTCMRGEDTAKCGARVSGIDLVCTGCNPDCNVNRITHRMRSMGAMVYLVPHSTGFSQWLARWEGKTDVGVTAVACLSHVLSGGYEMRTRRIASQCVILDYPGCHKHWSREGIPTDLNEERLVQIVSCRAEANPNT